MDKPISTKVHGVLDYVTAPTLFALPRVFGWGKKVTNILSGAAIGVLGYSVVTRYELGLFKLLPMQGHLTLDIMSGGMLALSPFMFLNKYERGGVITGTLVGLGLYEISAGLLTQTQPTAEQAPLGKVITQQLEELTSGLQEAVTHRS